MQNKDSEIKKASGRELRFRAWNKYSKKMEDFIISPQIMFGEGGSIWETDMTRADDCILMQYTGLKDKNGVDIYEGDILRGTGIDEKIRVWKAVSLHYFHHWQHTEDLIDEHGDIEVIGNIYQNPELLTNR